MEKPKDNWDKLEIIIRFFNGIVITGLTVVIAVYAQKVTDSIRYGELTQRLLHDLALSDDSVRIKSDLALITLNRTIGDKNPSLITDMAELIYLNDTASAKERTVAFTILEQRDSLRGKKLRDSLFKQNTDFSNKGRISNTSLPSAKPNDTNNIIRQDTISGQKAIYMELSKSLFPIVYIQTKTFQFKQKKELADLADTLKSMSYVVPQIEVVKKVFANEVRYFNDDDIDKAYIVAQKIKTIVKIQCRVQKLNNPNNIISKGQIEVWINK